MATAHHARVVWDADADDFRAHTVLLAGQELAASAAPEFGGNGEKADPEELFVASLSGCHMLWFLHLARDAGLRVRSYEDDPEGVLDRHRFTRVVLRPQVEFEDVPAGGLVEQLHERAHEACFIANSVSCPVEVEPQ